MDDDDEARRDSVRKVAKALIRRGVAAAEVRQYRDADRDPLWPLVADEMDAIEARRGLRVLPGGASRHPLAVRLAAIADKHPESPPALAVVPARRQRRYRG